ncbi:selenocysteine-specific translation elongation factor [Planctomycetota bacterium]
MKQQIHNVIIGTAGHIDHGKTALVEKLTGINADRLKEEKERGMTIDLGFASVVLPDGRRVGFLDVPGHEKFIKNMVAGCSSVDYALMVIAADDGPMPQTREHLEIMALLGFKRGLVTVTKIDLVDDELLEIQLEEVADLVKGTFLEGTPVCQVSSETGAGIDQLRQLLFDEVMGLERIRGAGPFRMPIQRVFSVPGQGAVLTGVPVSGNVSKGSAIEVLPQGFRGKVRHVQAYFLDVESAGAGHSSAINVSDVDFKTVRRGDIVTQPGYFQATQQVDIKLNYLASAKWPLRQRAEVRFHYGTKECLGSIQMFDRSVLQPGKECFAQVLLDEKIAVIPGDRYILRLPSPAMTIGGGTVLWVNSGKLKHNSEVTMARFKRLDKIHDPAGRVLFALDQAAFTPMSPAQLRLAGSIMENDLADICHKFSSEDKIVPLQRGKFYLSKQYLDRALEEVLAAVKEVLEEIKSLSGIERSQLKSKFEHWPEQTFNLAINNLEESGSIIVEGNLVTLPGREVKLTVEEQRVFDWIIRELNTKPFAPPTQADLQKRHGDKDVVLRIIKLMGQQDQIVRITGNIILTREAWEQAAILVKEGLSGGEGKTSAGLKPLFNTSRKYLIPLLESLDAAGITFRQGDLRYLREE